MGFAYFVALRHFAAESQFLHPVSVVVLGSNRGSIAGMHRRKILSNDAICHFLVRHNVPDVSLHGFSGIQHTGFFVLPVHGTFQQSFCFVSQLLAVLLLVFPDHSCDLFILQLRLIHFPDSLDVVSLRIQIVQLNLTFQQAAHLCVVPVNQQILVYGPFPLLACRTDVFIGFFHLFRRTRHFCSLLLRSFLCKPPHVVQFRHGTVHRVIEVPLCPRFECFSIFSVVVIQRLFHLLNAPAHFKHPPQLICRVRDCGREQCWILFAQSFINHVHRRSVVADPQRAHGRLPEVVVVRNVALIFRADLDGRGSQNVLDILVLVVVFRVSLNAPFIGFLKQRVQTFLRNFAVPQIFVGNASHKLLQIASLHAHRNTQCPSNPPQQRVLCLGQRLLCLGRNGGCRQLRHDVILACFAVQNRFVPLFRVFLLLLVQIPESFSLRKLSFQLRHDVIRVFFSVFLDIQNSKQYTVDRRSIAAGLVACV